jgi:hypothetical protein
MFMELSRWLEVDSYHPSLFSFPGLELTVIQDFLEVFWRLLYVYGIIELVRGWFLTRDSSLIPSSRTKYS